MPLKGHKPSPETIKKMVAARAKNRAKFGAKTKKRAEESKVEESAGDADYCMANNQGRVYPHFNKLERGWD